jgi:NIPSNAP protein
MKRRDFLQGSLLASTALGLGYAATGQSAITAEHGDNAAGRDFYELRTYRLKAGAPHGLLDGYLEKALIPAFNRLGTKPIGVFTEAEPKDGPAVWVLIPHASPQAFADAAARIQSDPDYQKAGAAYLNVKKTDAAFERIDSWLLLAFTGMPRLEIPALTRNKKARIFEMRTYESFSEVTALKKVEMFNSGEIEVMREVNLSPVFYGQALAGRDLPHLTYMLCGANRDLHKEHFTAFTKHPTWNKLKNDPQFADTVSKITSRFLEPRAYSQI